MNSGIASAFAEATKSTFYEMFGSEPEQTDSRELSQDADHGWGITGLIGLAGHVQGVVALRLTADLAGKLLAGSGVKAVGEAERQQLEGGLVGELCNIIAGSVSSKTGFDFEIAPPVVIRGPNHKIGWPAIAPVTALGFKGGQGDFELDVCVKS